MALDRYTRKATLDVPDPITDVASRQALSSSQSLERRLDAISNMFYESRVADAEQKGKLFGVKNVPTMERITLAMQKGEDTEQFFQEGGTVFGDAARNIQAEIFRNTSYAAFADKVKVISDEIEKDLITPDQAENIGNTLQAEIDGVYDVIAEVSPEQAVKFGTQAATLANTVYQKANLKAIEIQKEAQLELIGNYETTFKDNFAMTLRTHKGDLNTTLIKMGPDMQVLSDIYRDLPNDAIKRSQILTKLVPEILVGQATNLLVANPQYVENMSETLLALRTGKVPEELAFYNHELLSEADRASILKNFRDYYKENTQIQTKQRELQKVNDTKTVTELTFQYNELADEQDKDQEKAAVIAKLEDIAKRNPSALSYKNLQEIVNGRSTLTVAEKSTNAYFAIQQMINSKGITNLKQLEDIAKEKGLSERQIQFGLKPYFISVDERRFVNGIKVEAKSALPPGTPKNILDSEIAKIETRARELNAADLKEGKTPDLTANIKKATEEVSDNRLRKSLNTKLQTLNDTINDPAYSEDIQDILAGFPKDGDQYSVDLDDPAVQAVLKKLQKESPSTYTLIYNNIISINNTIEKLED